MEEFLQYWLDFWGYIGFFEILISGIGSMHLRGAGNDGFLNRNKG
jgi:hypothetical protein